MILKTNLHFHAANDEKAVRYDIYQGIDRAKKREFDVLAYTSHKKFGFRQEYADFAAKKEILLIPGIEAEIERKHVVILNCNKGAEELKTFKELADYKKKNPQIFILAPHPFVFSLKSLYSKLLENIDLFDAIELTVFSNKIFNFNKKATEVAIKYQKPLIATSDTHFLKDLNRGYCLIDVEVPTLRPCVGGRDPDRNVGKKTMESIFTSLKKGNFENKLDNMGLFAMAEFQLKLRYYSIFQPSRLANI